MKLGLLILLIFLSCTSSKLENKSQNNSSSVEDTNLNNKTTIERYRDALAQFDLQYKKIIENETDIKNKTEEYLRLSNELKGTSVSLSDKEKLGTAEYSMRKKEYEKNIKNTEKFILNLAADYGWGIYIILDLTAKFNENKKSNKTRISNQEIVSRAFNSFREGNYITYEKNWTTLYKQRCIENSENKDKKCIRKMIETCSNIFGAKGNNLQSYYLNDEFVINSKDLVNIEELYSENGIEKLLQLKEIKSQWMIEIPFYGCKYIAEEGYEFDSKQKVVPTYEQSKWIDELSYLRHIIDDDEFQEKCPENYTKTVMKLYDIKNNKQIDEYTRKKANDASSKVFECERYVKNRCKNVIRVNNEYVVSYQTAGCEIRNVTKFDIENDVKAWRRTGMTEADIQNHLNLKNTIDFCIDAERGTYSWYGNVPKLEKKYCKKSD